MNCITECIDWLKCLFRNSKVLLHNDLATEEVSLVMVYLIETKVFQEVFYLVIDVQV